MKFLTLHHIISILSLFLLPTCVLAQTDLTAKITNPSFEVGTLYGWTWSGTTGYNWLGPNADGDATKNGAYICGIWNAGIGDAECSQTITGLASGYYKVTALATVSTNRLTNQRLFANSESQLYGSSSNSNYSASNLAVLTGLGETYSFAGHSESSAENGPFKKMTVTTNVSNGTLKIGFKVSGKTTKKGFVFTSTSAKGDEGFFKFDHFTLTEVSKVATLDGIALNYGTLDTDFTSEKTSYTATVPAGIKSILPAPIVSVKGETFTGIEPVDMSSGTGISNIVVHSPDGTTQKTYTITYKTFQTTYKKVTDGVEISIPNGLLKIKVCTDKIIEFSHVRSSTIPTKDSLVVNKQWDVPEFTVVDATDSIMIKTRSLSVRISKTDYLVRYFDSTGRLLLAEADRALTPTNVLGTTSHICTASFYSPLSEGLYGLGQHQQKVMNYKGNSVVLDQQNKEIALPFLLSTNGYGLLWDNYSYTDFAGDLAANTRYQFRSESGKMIDYYFFYGADPDSIIHAYRVATGKAPLFPKWAYGLFQSKDKYSSSNELLNMAQRYRDAGFPLDCIVQDWDYWTPDYWGSHIMNATRYPNPKSLIDSLHGMNLHAMISIWPVFHSSTSNYQAFNAINAMYPSSGAHHFYDPHNASAKKIYWNQLKTQLFAKYGWDAWWADNDEPQGYPDGFDRKNFMTAKGPGATYYNTYPIEHTAGVYDGWRKDIPDKRLFTLSRSAFSGQQRYATAAWSGDISSNWNDFQLQLSAGLNFCMSGMPYWTTDIGGYLYVDWSTANNNELMTRWFQYGAFCPIFRIHGQGEKALVSKASFTENTIDNLAKTDKLRYRLMPYIYSLAWKVTNENYTMMRHLVMDYPTDLNVRALDNQYLFGPAMMINPVTTANTVKRSVYLPAGQWYDFWTGTSYSGNQTITADAPIDKIPILIKAGSILPLGPEIAYATQSVDPIEIRVYKGADGNFVLYEDEGDNYNYEKGFYSEIPFTYRESGTQLSIGARKGSFTNMLEKRTFKIVLVNTYHGTGLYSPAHYDTIVHYDGSPVNIVFATQSNLPQTHFEFESATLSGNIQVSAVQSGFSGSGYVTNLSTSHDNRATFQIRAPQTGYYKLVVRYATGSTSTRRHVSLLLNGQQFSQVNTIKTKDWSTWSTASTLVLLKSGVNSVSYLGDSTYIALDCMDVVAATSTPSQIQSRICRIKLTERNAYLDAGTGFVDVTPKDSLSRSQLWKIEATRSGIFKITSMLNNKVLTWYDQSGIAGFQTAAYDGSEAQNWKIDDFGNGIVSIAPKAAESILGVNEQDRLDLLSDHALLSTYWFFEDTVETVFTSLEEVFDYQEGRNLHGLGSGVKGWGSAWTVYEGTTTDFSIKPGISYNGLTTSGNKLTALTTSNASLRAYRDLFPTWKDDGQNIWISFLMDINNPTSLATTWQGVSLNLGSNERVLIGKNWGKNVLGLFGYDATEVLSSMLAYSMQPTWVVVMIKTSGDASNEKAYMWLNPDPKKEPTLANAQVSSTVQINNGINRIVFHMGNTAGISAGIDEFRMGRTFNLVSSPLTSKVHPISTESPMQIISDSKNKTWQLYFQSDNQDAGCIELMDLSGKILMIESIELHAGLNTFSIHQKVGKGVYILKLISSKHNIIQKVMC